MKINENIKKILVAIGLFFSGVVSTVCAVLLHNRRADATIRDKLTEAEGRNTAASDTVKQCSAVVDDCQQSVNRLQERSADSEAILREIREHQKLEDMDNGRN